MGSRLDNTGLIIVCFMLPASLAKNLSVSNGKGKIAHLISVPAILVKRMPVRDVLQYRTMKGLWTV